MKHTHYGTVLIVDDEPNAVRVLSAILSNEGYQVDESFNVDSAIETLQKKEIDAIVTDLRMPGKDGMQFFNYIVENHLDVPVIFLTAFGTVESAVQAMNKGAFYYFIKPPDYNKLKNVLSKAIDQHRMKREIVALKTRLSGENRRSWLISDTPEMRRVIEMIEAIKDSSSNVLITGETGTGKELVARAIYTNSNRKDKPFVAVNCAAIPKDLIEAEIFGFEKGAFTGAVARRVGKFEDAEDGIAFLDEIGELDLSLQSKLLRVLQEREIERIGSNRKIKVRFRLLCSTNRDLREEVRQGLFREDLYYRINVVEIGLKPLRERHEDIPLLIAEFVREFCEREKKTLHVSTEVVNACKSYHWPGNIRQLRNVVERAVVLARGDTITLRELPEDFAALKHPLGRMQKAKSLKEIEEKAVRDALLECGGNKSKASKTLGISRKAFYKKLRDLHLMRNA